MSEIILDLTNSEFNDQFVDDRENQLWQVEAKKRLIDLLKTNVIASKDYRDKRKGKIYTSHNSIYISGKRGAGKTVFLRNVANIWDNNKANVEGSIHFIDVIDPTLLENHDKFSNVIIAQVYNAVEERIKRSHDLKGKKSSFYSALKKLADSLGKNCEFSDHTGIDRIMKYSSGVQLEKLFHEFIEESLDILKCDAIAIPIDDVDMALNRAFEVMDDVRRLLSCPYIIPLVSGDDDLYRQMTHAHFEKEAYEKHKNSYSIRINGERIAKKLSEEYLTKVFPNQMRLPLEPIERLLPTLIIKFGDSGNHRINFSKYQTQITKQFYPYCNGQERNTDWPIPRSARELSQIIHALPPKVDTEEKKTSCDEWRVFQSWAEQKQDGVAYTNAEAYLAFVKKLDSDSPFNINDYICFNPKLQTEDRYFWSKSDFYNKQLEYLSDITASNNEAILKSVFNDSTKTLRSMPPLEFYHGNLSIALANIRGENKRQKSLYDESISELNKLKDELSKSECDDNKSQMEVKQKLEQSYFLVLKNSPALLDLYTHKDYYNTLSNRTYNVFFSRAFEIIFYSFVCDCDKGKITRDLECIFNRPHFYSIHNVNPTKTFDTGSNEDEEVEFDEGSYKETIRYLTETIFQWKENNIQLFSSIQKENIFPIFAAVFNKVFSQLHILRNKMCGDKYKNENLSDSARRFEYIFINALVSLIKKPTSGHVIQANTAMTDTYSTLRSHAEFINKERTLSRNVKFHGAEACMEEKLMELAWTHPIFMINNSRTNEMVVRYPLGKHNNFVQFKKETVDFVEIPSIKKTRFLNLVENIKDSVFDMFGTLNSNGQRFRLKRENFEEWALLNNEVLSKYADNLLIIGVDSDEISQNANSYERIVYDLLTKSVGES